MSEMNSQDFIVDEKGTFRFTQIGLENQTLLLAKAGIDARTIKTFDDYLDARRLAAPYFIEYLQEEIDKRLAGKPDTLELRAIRSVVFGSPEEQAMLLERLKRKLSLKIV